MAASQQGGLVGRDVRAKHDAWRLPCNPAAVGLHSCEPLSCLLKQSRLMYGVMQGLLTGFACDPVRRDWLVTTSAKGCVSVWDLRFQARCCCKDC